MQVLYWLAPEDAFLPNTNAPALLIERRTLTLTLDPKQQETALHWKSEFEVGPRTNTVTLTGANYHGLGMRFLQELDPLAVHLTPEGSRTLSSGKQDVSAHRWEAVVFDHPGPTRDDGAVWRAHQRPGRCPLFRDEDSVRLLVRHARTGPGSRWFTAAANGLN